MHELVEVSNTVHPVVEHRANDLMGEAGEGGYSLHIYNEPDMTSITCASLSPTSKPCMVCNLKHVMEHHFECDNLRNCIVRGNGFADWWFNYFYMWNLHITVTYQRKRKVKKAPPG